MPQFLKPILRMITPPFLWRMATTEQQEPPTAIDSANRQWWANVHRGKNDLD